MGTEHADAWLAAFLGGRGTSGMPTPDGWSDLCRRAEHHRVLPLVAPAVLAGSGVPGGVRDDVREALREAVVVEAIRERELVSLLEALSAERIRPLLFKGAALAYTCYDRPELRPRTDTDLLVREEQCDAARAVLTWLGYTHTVQFTGDLVTYQAAYVKRRDDTSVHVVDLHWRAANPQVFGDVLAYDEAAAEAVPVRALGETARALSAVHGLLVACVHRVAHHAADPRLIWLVDIRRIARGLTTADWTRFATLAVERRVSSVCRRSLDDARRLAGAAVPDEILARLAGADADEPSASFLVRRRHAAVVAQDLAALPSWTSRARLVRQHAFPPASYMRKTYAPGSRWPLALLYVKRAWSGARKWLTHA